MGFFSWRLVREIGAQKVAVVTDTEIGRYDARKQKCRQAKGGDLCGYSWGLFFCLKWRKSCRQGQKFNLWLLKKQNKTIFYEPESTEFSQN